MKCPKCRGDVPILGGATYRKGLPYYKCKNCGASLAWHAEAKVLRYFPVYILVSLLLGFFPAWVAVPMGVGVLALGITKTFTLEPEDDANSKSI